MSLTKIYKTKGFSSVAEIIYNLADQIRPPERIRVSTAASLYRKVNNPGSYVGDWDNRVAPYMVEPMDMMASRDYTNMAFVGPAQSGKTDALIINGLLYNIRVDPMDTMLFCPTEDAARDFGIRRVDRLHRHSPAVGSCILSGATNDSTFEKHYVSGTMLTLSNPTVTNLAGRPVGRVLLTDYDRMPEDIGGDGGAYDLADKRTTTFNSFRMCMAESSPSRPILDLKWMAKEGTHEAPPCTGIIALYNRGDRRRWHWPCPLCGTYFEGKFQHLIYMKRPGLSNLEISETVAMQCPHCEEAIHPDERQEMQQWGVWVPEGMTVNRNGLLEGRRPKTKFASYWLRGVAAAFVTWSKLVQVYLDAMDEFNRTGTDESLKKFWNNDMGEPYFPIQASDMRLPEKLQQRAVEREPKKVPLDVRFLIAQVDVQKNSFRVQVTGIKPGHPFDIEIIDSFEIRKSKREDVDGDHYMVKPASYLEDWDLVEEKVIDAMYEIADETGRKMSIAHTVCDAYGKAGVTGNAYDFYRKLKATGKHIRFHLLKGDPTPGVPMTRISYPDSQRKDMKSAARGDIPVLMINSNMVKDMLNGRLDVVEPGKGMITFPDWLPDEFYMEMCAEVKDAKGKWVNVNNARNEAWDLTAYCIACGNSPKILDLQKINWEKPPAWAAEIDSNSLVTRPDGVARFAVTDGTIYDYQKIAEQLA